jgi:MFS family permease
MGLLLGVIYLAFISLGLPDALLGAAWPTMRGEFGVPVSYAGAVSMIISFGTILSSIQSDRLTKWLGAGKITAVSAGLIAAGLFGFSASGSFWMLCVWAVPYGLGAGGVDAALNNYVALHYKSRHMSWLHCMWGVGASLGPLVMGYALTAGYGWNGGYLAIAILQIALTAVLAGSLPLWKGRADATESKDGVDGKTAPGMANARPRPIAKALAIPGAKERSEEHTSELQSPK